MDEVEAEICLNVTANICPNNLHLIKYAELSVHNVQVPLWWSPSLTRLRISGDYKVTINQR
jgi:hypothetical protein